MLDVVGFQEAKSTALEAFHNLLNLDPAPTTLQPIEIFEVSGFNDSAAVLYWQLHNGTGVPAGGTVAIYSVRVPAGQSLYWKPLGGFRTDAGGIWVSSTTAATYTAGTASFWCLVKFLALFDPDAAHLGD